MAGRTDCALVDLPDEVIQQAESPDAIRKERLRRFRQAAFSLHVEEHFSRTKRDRDRIIYSMLRCKSRPSGRACSLPSVKVNLILQPLLFAFLKVLKVPKVVGLDQSPPTLVIPSSGSRLANANEGDLIGPFAIGDVPMFCFGLTPGSPLGWMKISRTSCCKSLYDAWLQRQLGFPRKLVTALSRPSTFQLYDRIFVFKTEAVAGLFAPLSNVNHRNLGRSRRRHCSHGSWMSA